MATHQQEFDQFMKTRDRAAKAYVSGDAGPLKQIVTKTSEATFFGPRGGYRQGADVAATYERDVHSFRASGESNFEVLQSGSTGDLAFWTGLQRAKAHLAGQERRVSMDLRVTEVFRREDGAWRLVHRHADMMATEAPSKSS